MAEEKEKTNKPKSTLIKHRKPEPAPEKLVEIKEKKKNLLKCRNDFGWHKEEEKLLKIYNK